MLKTTPTLFYTVSSKEIRQNMPEIPVMLVATSFIRYDSQGKLYLMDAKLPAHIKVRFGDCGGFRVAKDFFAEYPYELNDYIRWLYTFMPQVAAMWDWPCTTPEGNYPGMQEVKNRQELTTKMVYWIWQYCAHDKWAWCPTIQGYTVEEYRAHARDMKTMIRMMHLYYSRPEWKEKGLEYTFRVGIGSLCRKLTAAQIREIIRVVSEEIGDDIPLQLWGTKYKYLKDPGEIPPQVTSMDTGAFNALFGKTHEERRESGLSVAQFTWQVMQPRYAEKIDTVMHQSRQGILDLEESFVLQVREGYQLYEVYHQVHDFFHFSTANSRRRWFTDPETEFYRVAVVEARDIDEAWELTNHVESSWMEGKHVLWYASPHLRSTSVGDVIIPLETQKPQMVASFGFEPLCEEQIDANPSCFFRS